MRRPVALALAILLFAPGVTHAQRYTTPDGRLRVALAKQPFSPTGISAGPNTMANGGIQQILEGMGVMVRIDEAALTPERGHRVWRVETVGNGAGSFRRYRGEERARWIFHCWPAGDVPFNAGTRRRSATFRTRAEARSKSACCGSMRILISTLLRPRAAVHWAACRWRLQPVARLSGCAWMRTSTHLFRTAMLSWPASASPIRSSSNCLINHPSSSSALTTCGT